MKLYPEEHIIQFCTQSLKINQTGRSFSKRSRQLQPTGIRKSLHQNSVLARTLALAWHSLQWRRLYFNLLLGSLLWNKWVLSLAYWALTTCEIKRLKEQPKTFSRLKILSPFQSHKSSSTDTELSFPDDVSLEPSPERPKLKLHTFDHEAVLQTT